MGLSLALGISIGCGAMPSIAVAPLWVFDASTLSATTSSNDSANAALVVAAGITHTIAASPTSVQTAEGIVVKTPNANQIRAGRRLASDPVGLVLTRSWTQRHLQSESIDQWSKSTANTVITANAAIAPDGTLTADLVDFTAETAGNGVFKGQTFGQTGVMGRHWVMIRGDVGGERVTLGSTAGTVSAVICDLTTSWQRFYTDELTAAGGGAGVFIKKVSGNKIYVWGANGHDRQYADEYATTTTTSVAIAGNVWQQSIVSLLSAGRLTLEICVQPFGRETAYPTASFLFYRDASNYISLATTGVITVCIGGVSYSTPTGATWAENDVVRFWIASGGGSLSTVVAYSINGGPYTTIGTGSAQGSWPSSGACNVYGDGTGNSVLSGRFRYARTWPASASPTGGAAVSDPVQPDYFGVLGSGQSLSVGTNSGTILSTSQPYSNVMPNTGVLGGNTGFTSFSPLVEAAPGETPQAGCVNQLSAWARASQMGSLTDFVGFTEAMGQSGAQYVLIQRFSASFEKGLYHLRTAKALADAASKTLVVPFVTIVHGETDHSLGTSDYQTKLATWQRDYDEAIRAITGQATRVMLVQSQMSQWTKLTGTTSRIPEDQMAASRASNGLIITACPKYFFASANAASQDGYSSDGLHLLSPAYRRLGEYHAKAYRAQKYGGGWVPLAPSSVVRTGATIDVTFAGNVGNLVLDTTTVSDPGNYGFEFLDDSGATPAISSVTITGSNTVRVVLASTPTGANKFLAYAYTGTAGNSAGATTGARGCLRDSDTTTGRDGASLVNWCMHFKESC